MLRNIWYSRLLIILITGVATICAAVVSFVQLRANPQYTSTTVLTMLPSQTEISYTMHRGDFAGITPADVLTQTHTELLLSRSISRKVVDAFLQEYSPPLKRPGISYYVHEYALKPLSKSLGKAQSFLLHGRYIKQPLIERLTNRMMRSIKVDNVPGSFILSISVTWNDPAIAQKAARLLAHIYIESTASQEQKSLKKVAHFIEQHLALQESELAATDKEIQEFKSRTGIHSIQDEVAVQSEQLAYFLSEKSRLEVELFTLQSRLENATRGLPTADSLTLMAQVTGTQKALKSINALVQKRERELSGIPEMEHKLLMLEKRKEAIKENIAAFRDKLIETRLSEAATLNQVRVIDDATLPTYPSEPNVLLSTLAALLAGFMLSLAIIFCRDAFSSPVRSRDDLPSGKGRFIGILPRIVLPWDTAGRLKNPFAASREILEKHAEYIWSHFSRHPHGSAMFLTSHAGGGHHADSLALLMHKSPTDVVLANFDSALHHALEPNLLAVPAIHGNEPEISPQTDHLYRIKTETRHISYLDLSAGFKPGQTECQLESLKKQFRFVIIISPPLEVFFVPTELERIIDASVVMIRAHVDSVVRIRQALDRCLAFGKPVSVLIDDVQYPWDFLFKNMHRSPETPPPANIERL